MANTRRRIAREEILEGAASILDSGVFGDLTVDSLARTLHMSKSTLYKHFSSKDALVVAMVDSLCRTTEREIEDANFMTDALEALQLIFEIYGRHAARLPRAVILQRSRLPSSSQDRIELTSAIMGRAFRSLVNRGIERGVFREVNAEIAAACFIACARATMEAAARGEVAVPRGEAVNVVYELLMPGLGVAVPA